MGIKQVSALLLILLLSSFCFADYIQIPVTPNQQVRYIASDNPILDQNFYSNNNTPDFNKYYAPQDLVVRNQVNWFQLTNFPKACPSGTAITQLGLFPICSPINSNISSIDFNLLYNFPSACATGYAVQAIDHNQFTCIAIGGSSGVDTNWETSWSVFDANMRAEYNLPATGGGFDTNAETACADTEYLRGDGTCQEITTSNSFDSNIVKFVYDDLNLISVEGNARKLYVDANGFGIIESIEISTAGSGYVETNIIGINGGNGEATFIVTSVDEFGGITNISLSDRGDAYTIGNDIATNALTGEGVDATVNILSLLDYLTQLDYSIPFAISGAGAASPTEGSVFIGNDAGSAATSAYYSNFFGERAGSGAEGAEMSNFFGRNAGKNASNASKSNFFGNDAGVDASNASSSNFFGNYAGGGAISASGSNFFGENSGANATDATSSNFFGTSAGDGATYANSSNFFGTLAGQNAVYAASSNFFGANAGKYATSASTSNFFGLLAGYEATNAYSSNFFGTNAGEGATNASSSNFFGEGAGLNATDATSSNFFGANAGEHATDATSSNFFGANAGNNAAYASGSNFFGSYAGYVATLASSSNFFGNLAGANSTYADGSNFFGLYAGNNAPNARNSIFIGYTAGYEATNAANSIFLGENSGASDTVDNTYGGKIITLNSTPIDGGSGYSVGVPYLILGGNNDAFAYGGSGGGGTLENISLTFGGTNYEVGTYLLDGGNGDANIEITEVSPIQGFGSSILIGNNTSTGGFRDSVSIGKGTMNDAAQQMNLGNVLKINGIYKEATPSSTLMTGATVEMGDNNLNLGNITATGTICDSVGCIGTGGTGSNYTDENALALINSLDLNNTLNYLPSNTVIPVDTNWETSWATFDANMRAEYNLPATPSSGTDTNWETNFGAFDSNMKATYQILGDYITTTQADENYYSKSVSDTNWNKYTLKTDFNSYLTPQTCPAGQALRILGVIPTCIEVGGSGTDTNWQTNWSVFDSNMIGQYRKYSIDLNTSGSINSDKNILGVYIIGNGSRLTNLNSNNLTGEVKIANGGTNASSFNANKFLIYDGSKIADSAYYNTSFWETTVNLVNKTQLDGNIANRITITQADTNYWAKTNNLVNKTQLDGNLLPYITIAQADANYQPKGTSFITISQADTNYWAKSTNLVNKTQLDENLLLYYTRTQSDANWAKYQLLGSYITIPQADANYYSKSVSDTNWAKYLPLAGGKMTGDLNIGLKNAIDANSITFRNGAGKSWIDNNGTCMRLTSGTTTVFIGC